MLLLLELSDDALDGVLEELLLADDGVLDDELLALEGVLLELLEDSELALLGVEELLLLDELELELEEDELLLDSSPADTISSAPTDQVPVIVASLSLIGTSISGYVAVE